MTPLASVAMLEKFALLKIALCNGLVLGRRAAWAGSGLGATTILEL
jgi:hypothetical protein